MFGGATAAIFRESVSRDVFSKVAGREEGAEHSRIPLSRFPSASLATAASCHPAGSRAERGVPGGAGFPSRPGDSSGRTGQAVCVLSAVFTGLAAPRRGVWRVQGCLWGCPIPGAVQVFADLHLSSLPAPSSSCAQNLPIWMRFPSPALATNLTVLPR